MTSKAVLIIGMLTIFALTLDNWLYGVLFTLGWLMGSIYLIAYVKTYKEGQWF